MGSLRSRRAVLVASSFAGAGFFIGCRKGEAEQASSGHAATASSVSSAEGKGGEQKDGEEPEVTAVEDLMREHGVIRRALVVYREAGARLRAKASAVPVDALQNTAKLLRTFAEDYHEKQLEEAHIFPALKRVGGGPARDVDTLVAQHQRGREITDYVIAATASAIGPARAESLARTLDAFTRMYEEHAAIEDTMVFPAWKRTMSSKQLDEIGDLFEEIEHKTFGKDGFDDAVEKIDAIERALGLDLARFTAPSPPRA